MPGPSDDQALQFRGLRSFVPRNGIILKQAFPKFTVGQEYLMISAIGPPWTVLFGDVAEIKLDKKAVLVCQTNGVSARFKASGRTIQAVERAFQLGGIAFKKSATSTYNEVQTVPRTSG